MIRSLYSGSSGMKNHQVRMDVIGNNIANVNTTAFKSSRANFQDAIYQLLRSPSEPDATSGTGSINPAQVGTGMSIASIGINMTQGPTQNTGRPLDLAIQGNGFFCVTDGDNCYYTRNGVFYVDKDGYLVDSNGRYLVDGSGGSGTPGTSIQLKLSGTATVSTISIGKDGSVTATDTAGVDISPAEKIGLYTFANQEGLKQIGQSYYQEVTGTSGEATPIDPDDVGVYSEIVSCYLEMSNVNLTDEFVDMITTQRGYQANGRVITTSDQMLQELLDLKR